jgi:hypothetical protein
MGVLEPVKSVEKGGRWWLPVGREVKKAPPARRCDEGGIWQWTLKSEKGAS